jgi:hypothetical protein
LTIDAIYATMLFRQLQEPYDLLLAAFSGSE